MKAKRKAPSQNKKRGSGVPLPEFLRRLFWEYDAAALRWPRDKETIIPKILQMGSLSDYEWLRKNLTDAALRRWIVTHRGRGMTPMQLAYWDIILNLGKSRIRTWSKSRHGHLWGCRRTSA